MSLGAQIPVSHHGRDNSVAAQVLYALKGTTWRVLAFPFGGRGSDAACTLNPQAGRSEPPARKILLLRRTTSTFSMHAIWRQGLTACSLVQALDYRH